MMIRGKATFILTVLMILLIPSFITATINLGSMVNVGHLTLNKGESGTYKISFFTLGDEELLLTLTSEHPEEVRVDIHPSKLILRAEKTKTPYACSDCGWFVLNDGETYVKTIPVYVRLTIPQQISRNFYKIKIIAVATPKSPENTGKGIKQTLAQAREITLTAYVPGRTSPSIETVNLTTERMWIRKIMNPSRKTGEGGSILDHALNLGRTLDKIGEKLPTGFIIIPKHRAEKGIIVLFTILAMILLIIWMKKRR